MGERFLNEGYFSGKSLKLMPPDALISPQNAPKCVWRPGSAWTRWRSSQRSPRPLSWTQGVLLLRGRERECAQFSIQIWGIEAPGARVKLLLVSSDSSLQSQTKNFYSSKSLQITEGKTQV